MLRILRPRLVSPGHVLCSAIPGGFCRHWLAVAFTASANIRLLSWRKDMSRIRHLMTAGVSCWLIVAGTAYADAQEVKVKREFNQNEVRAGGVRRISTLIGASVHVQNS